MRMHKGAHPPRTERLNGGLENQPVAHPAIYFMELWSAIYLDGHGEKPS